MKKIVITGATSFIGVHLINELLKYGYDIYAVIRPKSDNRYRLENKMIHIVECGLDDINALIDNLPSSIDVFYHLAWEGARRPHRDNAEMQEHNYKVAVEAFRLAADKKCRTFIGAGSQAEYGKTVGIVTEDYPTSPSTEYGKYKLKACCEIIRLGKEIGISVKWPRIFSAYGRYDFEGTLLMSAIEKFSHNDVLEMTRGVQNWNYLYVRDIAKMLRLIGTTICDDGVYNFASEDNRLLRDYIVELRDIMHSKSKINFGAVDINDENVVSFFPNVDKMRMNFPGMKFHSFKDGIKEMMLK